MNPANQQRQNLSAEAIHNALCVGLTYALYEKREETAISAAYVEMVEQQHIKYHNEKIAWTACPNKKCIEAARMVADVRKPEILLTPLSGEMTDRFFLNIDPMPGCIRMWICDKPEVMPPTKEETRRIVVAS